MSDNYSHYTRLIKTQLGFHNSAPATWPKCPPRQCPSLAPAVMPAQGAPGGPVQLSTPRVAPGHWDFSHGLSCSNEPPPKLPISPRLTLQAPHHYWRLYFSKTWGLRRKCQLGHVMQRSVHFNLGRHAPRAFGRGTECSFEP